MPRRSLPGSKKLAQQTQRPSSLNFKLVADSLTDASSRNIAGPAYLQLASQGRRQREGRCQGDCTQAACTRQGWCFAWHEPDKGTPLNLDPRPSIHLHEPLIFNSLTFSPKLQASHPSSLIPKPSTPNPQLPNLNPEPSTLKPEP